MVGARQPIRVHHGWLIEVRLPRLSGKLNEEIYMISTSNNPVSLRIASLPDGIPNRRPKRESYLLSFERN